MSACQPLNRILPTLPTTTSAIITGEFDSECTDIGDLDVIDAGARPPSYGPGQRQRVDSLERAATDDHHGADNDGQCSPH